MTLYTVPKSLHVSDVTVLTTVESDLSSAEVNFDVVVEMQDEKEDPSCEVKVIDAEGNVVETAMGKY